MPFTIYDPKTGKYRQVGAEEFKAYWRTAGYQYDLEAEMGTEAFGKYLVETTTPEESRLAELGKRGLGGILLSPEQTAESGFYIPEQWQLQLVPDVSGIYTQTLITPEGRQVTFGDVSVDETGQWFTAGLLPERVPEIPQVSEAEQANLQNLVNMFSPFQTTGVLEYDLQALSQYIANAPTAFLEDIQPLGRTTETESLLRLMWGDITEQDLRSIFGPRYLPPGVGRGGRFEPTLSPQAILELEPEWEHIRTGEVITESEKARRYPKGYEAELDDWRLTVETGRNYFHVFRVFGESLLKLPKQLASAILRAIQPTGASVVNKDWADEIIADASTDLNKFAEEVSERYTGLRLPIKLTDLATLPESMAFSLTSMGAGLGVGLPIAFAPVPGARVAAWAAGTAASGAVAFNMSRYQIMQIYLEVKNDQMKAAVGRELTIEEEEQLKSDFSWQATKYGLWEAVPEALSNLAFAKLLTMPLGKMVGKNTASRILSKVVGIYGQEFLTETITQKGQSAIEVESGLREGRISWIEAFKEIAPQTFLLTTILGGLGQVGVSSVNRIKQSLKKEIGDRPIYDAIKENITIDMFAELEDEAVTQEQAAKRMEEAKEAEERIAKIEPLPEPTPLPFPTEPEALAERILAEARLEEARVRREAVPEVKIDFQIDVKDVTKGYEPSVVKVGDSVRMVGEPIDVGFPHKILDIRIVNGLRQLKLTSRAKPQGDWHTGPFAQLSKVTPKPPAVEVKPTEVEKPVVPVEVVPEEDVETKVRRQLTGLGRMYQEWWSKLKTAEQTKASLAKFVKENLPLNIRGKYISAVARVKTDAQLQTQIAKVQEFAELNSQKVLKAEIHKELKKASTKVKEHILKGKFTPEVQRRLDVVAHNLELDRDAAREKIAENITVYQEGKLGYEEMLNENEMLNFAGIDGMSAEELANTLEYIKILETIGKSERQAKQEVATERINVIRSDISNILTGGQGLKTGIGAIPRGELIAKTGWWDAFTNWQYGIDSLADKLSKLDPTSKPYQSALSQFVAQVHRATIRQVSSTKVAFNRIKDIVGEVYGVKGTHDINQVLNSLEEEVNLGVFELTEEYKANHPSATTVTMKMTRNQMIAKYMQMQDPTLNDTFTTGMGWSQEVRDVVESNLTVEEKKLANAMFDFYEDYYVATNEIYQELFNVDMPHNPAYSPIRRDFEADIVENVLTMRDASQYASVLNGSLKARQRNIRPLRFNGALDILSNHIQQMEHFKAWATTMRDMRRVFGNKNVRLAIEQYHGRGVIRLIDTFLNQMARGGIETATTNRAADFLRRNFTKSILAIKPVIMLKQIPSLFGYMSEMKVTEFFGGIADFWTSPVANFKFLYANSGMYRARIEAGFERDIRAAMEKHGKQLISGRGKLTDWFLLQIRLGDTFAVTQGMWAKYQAGLKQGLSQEEAIAAAEDTTGRTQPSFGIDTLSAIQNGGSWLKLMTMFQNQPNKYFRMTSDNLRNFKYGRGSRAKAASTILLAWVLLPMMFQFIADAFQWKPERQARAGILGPLNFILIGGQLVQSMWGWLTDQPFDYQISPVAQTGRDLQMIFLKAKKLVEQKLDPYKDISGDDVASLVEFLAKAAGQVLGLPTPYFVQVSKLIRHKMQAGEELEIKDFLFSEWALQPPKKTAEEQVEELNLKLGEPEEGVEDKPLTDKPLKVYDTADWFREIGGVYDNVLPQDVLDNPNASKESKAWAEYEIARSKADILPNIALYKINTEDNGDTIIHYYQQWKARERITSLAKLKEFDTLYPKAYLGNVTRQQYNLLVKYLGSEDKDAFLENHPELKLNPRNEWLKVNPTDNALLALGGQAKILSLEAYKETQRLIKELDIPEDGIPEFTLPPEGSIENYFKYNDAVEEFSANSWEAQLIVAQDDALREFLRREPIDTPIKALELKIKHRELSDQYDAYGDRDSPLYFEDDDKREEARDKLKADNPIWVDDTRRIEAIEHEASDTIIESWVERGRLVDKFTAGSSQVKVWLIDHPKVHKWALEQELLTDDGSDWNEPVLRINAEWHIEDDEYDAIQFEDDKEQREERELYLENHPKYAIARRQRDGYGLTGAKGEKFTPEQIDKYTEYYTLDAKGYRQERYLIDDPDFAEAMHVIAGIDLPKASEVPLVQYDDIYDQFKADFDKLDGLANYKSPHYIENEDKRESTRQSMRFHGDGTPTEFGKAEKRREAFGKFFSEELVEEYVEWYTSPTLKKPDDYDDKLGWYEDDWFLQEHAEFYKEMRAKGIFTERRNFIKVPPREVYDLWVIYNDLPLGTVRKDYRLQYPELDDWLVLAKGYKPAEGEIEDSEELDEWEELARKAAKVKESIGKMP